MRFLYATPEITITRFDVSRFVMMDMETESKNEKPGDGWNAGIDGISNPDFDPGDLWG